MSSILWKSFNLCFSKFKCLPTITFSSPPANGDQDEGEEQEESGQENHKIFTQTASYPNPSSFFFKNYNSLFDSTSDDFFSSSADDPDSDSIPDFTSAIASHRFFFSSPGASNSLLDQPQPPQTPGVGAVVGGGVAVDKYSPNPYADFRASMTDMVRARRLTGDSADWEFLHELLECYLNLNPKQTHKFIYGAFADVIVSLLPSPGDEGCRKTSAAGSGAPSHKRRLDFV